MSNEHMIDLGLCAGLAIVLIASLAIFIAIKIEIAKLRRDLTRNDGPAGPPRSEDPLTEVSRKLPKPDRVAQREAALSSEREQKRAALAYTSNSTASSMEKAVSKDEALAALRRAWSAIPESVGSPAQ